MAPNIAATDPRPFPRAKLQSVRDTSRLGLDQTQRLAINQVREPCFSFPDVSEVNFTSRAILETVRLLDPIDVYGREIKARVEKIPDTVAAYDDRIEVLEKEAELDGYSLNSDSKATFLEFFKRNPLIRIGRLVLMENGNLRAVWKGDDGAHIGLQFLKNQSIQYVIFKHRGPSSPVSRVYGRDTTAGIMRQIDAFDLGSVLYT